MLTNNNAALEADTVAGYQIRSKKMTSISLQDGEWKLIVPAGENLDAVIRSKQGAFRASIGYPHQLLDTVIAVPPFAIPSNKYSRFMVNAGLPVYAQAVGGSAIATVDMVKPQA